MNPIQNDAVARVFDCYPPGIRQRLLSLRTLVLNVAALTPGVGLIEETLKWGEPAYVTSASRSGSTVRIGWKSSKPDRYAVYFHCQTNLIEGFRRRFPELQYEDNRAIVLHEGDVVPVEALSFCIATALTYHLAKRSQASARR